MRLQQKVAYPMELINLKIAERGKNDWSFVGGDWLEDQQGVLTAPPELGGRDLAIYTAQAYLGFEAEFEFRWDVCWSNAGFVFRATDARHFYMLHFPVVGQ